MRSSLTSVVVFALAGAFAVFAPAALAAPVKPVPEMKVSGTATVAGPGNQPASSCCVGHQSPTPHNHTPPPQIVHDWWTKMHVTASWKRAVVLLENDGGDGVDESPIGDPYYPGVSGGGSRPSDTTIQAAKEGSSADWKSTSTRQYWGKWGKMSTRNDDDLITLTAQKPWRPNLCEGDYCFDYWSEADTKSTSGDVKYKDSSVGCDLAKAVFSVGDEFPESNGVASTSPDIEFDAYLFSKEMAGNCGGSGRNERVRCTVTYDHDEKNIAGSVINAGAKWAVGKSGAEITITPPSGASITTARFGPEEFILEQQTLCSTYCGG